MRFGEAASAEVIMMLFSGSPAPTNTTFLEMMPSANLRFRWNRCRSSDRGNGFKRLNVLSKIEGAGLLTLHSNIFANRNWF